MIRRPNKGLESSYFVFSGYTAASDDTPSHVSMPAAAYMRLSMKNRNSAALRNMGGLRRALPPGVELTPNMYVELFQRAARFAPLKIVIRVPSLDFQT